MKESENKRIAFISFLQFIGVVSVIFGHSMNSIAVPGIFTGMKAWVYTYHMPLFFFVSAFLFSYKGGYDQGYKNIISKRFSRLIIPYIIWNVSFIFPKIIFYSTLPDQVQPLELSPKYIAEMLLYPRNNILGHTWFLFALFEMFLIAIFLDKAKKKKSIWIPVTLALVILNCFGIQSKFLAIGDLMKNGMFFWCGLMLGTYTPFDIEHILKEKSVGISVIILTVSTTIIWIFNEEMLINTLILGISILALFMIVQIKFGISGGLIEFVSQNSFPIYIMHWPVIMILRLFFYQKIGIPSVLAMIINFILGLAIPCMITYILRKVNAAWFRKICSVVFGM